jgi:predicted metal-dependent peptidase
MADSNKTEFNLEHHIIGLLQNEPFFAALSRRINKRASTGIPTAGVRVDPNTAQFEMLYNREFFGSLPKEQRLGVLKHEFYHLIFEHVTGRKPEKTGARIWNFATDLAINSHLRGELPDTCLMPGVGPFREFEDGLSAEQYLLLLKDKQKQHQAQHGEGAEGGGGDGLPDEGQFDSHEEWEENPDNPAHQQANDIARERLKDYVKEAAEEAAKKGWGSVSTDVRKTIKAALQTHVDWRKVLRYFVKTSTRANRSSTVKRLNKRYRYIHPGKKVNRQARIAVSIDQSGSVSDSMLEAFFGELNKLAGLAAFTVVPFDTIVKPELVYEWKKGDKAKPTRVMAGGTDFNAPTKYVNEKGFDGHIVLTDMMAAKPVASKCQRMWMTTKDCLRYQYFQTNERVLAID